MTVLIGAFVRVIGVPLTVVLLVGARDRGRRQSMTPPAVAAAPTAGAVAQQAVDGQARALLVALGVIWAASWPVIKIGVATMPPICAALTRLPPGRASVLAYSTPLWVMPLSAWWLRERITRRGLAGVAVGLAGAAGAWAVAIVYVRAHRFQTSTVALAPWQMLVAALMLWPLAIGLDGPIPSVTTTAAAALCFVSPVATAFAYWAAVEIGRSVRATTMSMTLLAVPALGALLSSIVLHEIISLSLVLGLFLIVTGIFMAHPRQAGEDSVRATFGG